MRGTMVDETNEMDFELREIKRNMTNKEISFSPRK